ncbi:unnamed protein product [Adineta ricciae]|uniref:Uncharacterized protein n=1 Tax=Adineta ricciae TaxID=249248 RepID=A0A813QLD2_ADIRI|nr:unnamed protein product [Adineta ricciae]CAF0979903.1 unnamed protein product [Adineta ricciae]
MILRLIVLCCILFSTKTYGLRRRCNNTGVLFLDKVLGSPIVVYGEPTRKSIYLETDTELLFNVTFRVDCVLKATDIADKIEITGAGIKAERMACQWLDPGNVYIVFLEKCPSNSTLYCPLDYQERVVDDMMLELLQRTCHLTSRPPLHSTANHCPNVSMAEFCSDEEGQFKIIPKSKYVDDDSQVNMKISFNNSNQFFPQTNPTKTRSIADQIADNPNSHGRLAPLASMWMALLVIFVCN